MSFIFSVTGFCTRLIRQVRRWNAYCEVMNLFAERRHAGWSEELKQEFLKWRRDIKEGRAACVIAGIDYAQRTQRSFNGFAEWSTTLSRLKLRTSALLKYQ